MNHRVFTSGCKQQAPCYGAVAFTGRGFWNDTDSALAQVADRAGIKRDTLSKTVRAGRLHTRAKIRHCVQGMPVSATLLPWRGEDLGAMADESYLSIGRRLGLAGELPVTPDWSAAPDFLGILIEHCLVSRPGVVIECGSGVSTLVLARCCQINGVGRVFSLEHSREYADAARARLGAFGLSAHAGVIHAPLVEYVIGSGRSSWYRLDGLPTTGVDLLVIDGPPGILQPRSRYPALHLLERRLAARCAVFLDDAQREDEKAILGLWRAEHPEFEYEYRETERGCAILKRVGG